MRCNSSHEGGFLECSRIQRFSSILFHFIPFHFAALLLLLLFLLPTFSILNGILPPSVLNTSLPLSFSCGRKHIHTDETHPLSLAVASTRDTYQVTTMRVRGGNLPMRGVKKPSSQRPAKAMSVLCASLSILGVK